MSEKEEQKIKLLLSAIAGFRKLPKGSKSAKLISKKSTKNSRLNAIGS